MNDTFISSGKAKFMRKSTLATAEYEFDFCNQSLIATLIAPIDQGPFNGPDAVFAFIREMVRETKAQDEFKGKCGGDHSIPCSVFDEHLGNRVFRRLSDEVTMYTYGITVKHEDFGRLNGSRSGTLTTYDFTVR